MRTAWIGGLVYLLSLAAPLPAQVPDAESTAESAPEGASTGRMYLYGTGLGLVGFFAGGSVGLALSSNCTGDDYCEFRGFLLGAAVGGTTAMALGVHLGNDRRGSFPLDLFTGAAIWGAGIGTAAATGWDDTVTLVVAIGVPIAQLLATTAVERATGRSREAKRSVSVYGGPDLRGGVVVGASLTF